MAAGVSSPKTSNLSSFSWNYPGEVKKVNSLRIVLIFLIPASPLKVALTPITLSAAVNYCITDINFPLATVKG
jgi:hypothetical protein